MRYVDYDKIKLNIDNLLKYNDVIIVLKDNAYGFGIENILDICVGSGINFLR